MNQPQPLDFQGDICSFFGGVPFPSSRSWVFLSNHEAEGGAVGEVLLNTSSTICCPSPTTSFRFRRGDVGRVEKFDQISVAEVDSGGTVKQ